MLPRSLSFTGQPQPRMSPGHARLLDYGQWWLLNAQEHLIEAPLLLKTLMLQSPPAEPDQGIDRGQAPARRSVLTKRLGVLYQANQSTGAAPPDSACQAHALSRAPTEGMKFCDSLLGSKAHAISRAPTEGMEFCDWPKKEVAVSEQAACLGRLTGGPFPSLLCGRRRDPSTAYAPAGRCAASAAGESTFNFLVALTRLHNKQNSTTLSYQGVLAQRPLCMGWRM